MYLQTNTWLREQFTNLFRFYNGVRGTDVYSNGWNTLFIVVSILTITLCLTSLGRKHVAQITQ